jgi:phage terminase large subunit
MNIADTALRIATPRTYVPLRAHRRFKGMKGGRGGGKSHYVAETLVRDCFRGHVRAACIREVQNSIKDSVKQLIEDKIRKHNVLGHFKITEREIVGPNESLFIFRGLQNHTAASIKSLEGFNRPWYEEAQTLTQRSLDLAIPTFRTPGTEQLFTWNPEFADDPVDKFFREGIEADDPDFICVTVNYEDNPWFPDDLRRDMERDKLRDIDKYNWIWRGGYRQNSEAQVFKNWKVERFDAPPPGTEILGGGDWGFSVDPTVGTLCFIVGRTLYIWREVWAIGCEIDRTPALFDKLDPEWDAKHTDPNWQSLARRVPIIADSARPETISYMQKHGYPHMRRAVKGPGSVEDGIEFLKNYDIVIHPDCIHTIDEYKLYSYKIDKKTQKVTTDLEDKNNHCIDADRYAVENVRRHPPTVIVGTYRGT